MNAAHSVNGAALKMHLSQAQCEPIYAYAYLLCSQARYTDALPIFRLLCLYGPASAKHAVGLEGCLNQLGQTSPRTQADDALLFRMRALAGGATPSTACAVLAETVGCDALAETGDCVALAETSGFAALAETGDCVAPVDRVDCADSVESAKSAARVREATA